MKIQLCKSPAGATQIRPPPWLSFRSFDLVCLSRIQPQIRQLIPTDNFTTVIYIVFYTVVLRVPRCGRDTPRASERPRAYITSGASIRPEHLACRSIPNPSTPVAVVDAKVQRLKKKYRRVTHRAAVSGAIPHLGRPRRRGETIGSASVRPSPTVFAARFHREERAERVSR